MKRFFMFCSRRGRDAAAAAEPYRNTACCGGTVQEYGLLQQNRSGIWLLRRIRSAAIEIFSRKVYYKTVLSSFQNYIKQFRE